MRIVFEGADLTGKSTLAIKVAEALQLPLRGRITRVGPDKVKEAQIEDYKKYPNAVLDRCYWMSDLIYEPIYSQEPSVFLDNFKEFLQDQDTIYIILVASKKVITNRFYSRGDDIYNVDQILTANRNYMDFAEAFPGRHTIVFDTYQSREQTIQDSIEALITLIQEELVYASN